MLIEVNDKLQSGVCVCLTGERGEVWLDVELFEQYSSGEVDGEVTPRLLREKDVGPGGRSSTAVRGRGLEQNLGRLSCWTA